MKKRGKSEKETWRERTRMKRVKKIEAGVKRKFRDDIPTRHKKEGQAKANKRLILEAEGGPGGRLIGANYGHTPVFALLDHNM